MLHKNLLDTYVVLTTSVDKAARDVQSAFAVKVRRIAKPDAMRIVAALVHGDRLRLRLSQRDVGEISNIHVMNISSIERATYGNLTTQVLRVLKALGRDPTLTVVKTADEELTTLSYCDPPRQIEVRARQRGQHDDRPFFDGRPWYPKNLAKIEAAVLRRPGLSGAELAGARSHEIVRENSQRAALGMKSIEMRPPSPLFMKAARERDEQDKKSPK